MPSLVVHDFLSIIYLMNMVVDETKCHGHGRCTADNDRDGRAKAEASLTGRLPRVAVVDL